LLPAGTDPDWFLRQLGIEKVEALVNGAEWTLEPDLAEKTETDPSSAESLLVDETTLRALHREQRRRLGNREAIELLVKRKPSLDRDAVLCRWRDENQPIAGDLPELGDQLPVVRAAADPDWAKQRIAWETENGLRTKEDKYRYSRAFRNAPYVVLPADRRLTVLDPTAGGGSIPFEALRLGHNVIANDLNPVAGVILNATLDYPVRFGPELVKDIMSWGTRLRESLVRQINHLFPASPLSEPDLAELKLRLSGCPEGLLEQFSREHLDGFLYVRQVTCPHCGGEAPLLNTSWLSREGDQWGVRVIADGRQRGGKVRFETYRVRNGKGPNGEDPDFATVSGGVGFCVHCHQAISSDEIKSQARGESAHGKWRDRLYCVVAVRHQPKVDTQGRPLRYTSGERAGEIKTEKVTFFRPTNQRDLEALAKAEDLLKERWPEWERQGLIPTEGFPQGNDMRPVVYGMTRWCDMFTPRQLLGHLILVEELNRLKPDILRELGRERGRAVVTYLQFAIDKGLDYNSRQTRWHYSRGVLINTFGRHDYSLKWTFGEMVFSGRHSGAAWGLSQVVDAYHGMAELMAPLNAALDGSDPPIRVLCGTAAHLDIPDRSVDLVCMDPPYYNNVQYAELSDYFYVWQKRTLGDLYPDLFRRRLVNKTDEAVANPTRDGSTAEATRQYERLINEIFSECRRVLKDEGIMTVMFTHKTQAAWETLTRSLIEAGWTITSSMPVESEAAESIHQKDTASAASSIFLTCRKRKADVVLPATWIGFGGTGVAWRVREAVRRGLTEFEPLRLNPVDEMVASYGRALQVLSEHWPVLDGDELVSPIRAMNEASAVVAQYQMTRLTQGHLKVDDLSPEAAMALTLFGIFGTAPFPYDEALNLSRSLGIGLEGKGSGYAVNGRMIGINDETRGTRAGRGGVGDARYHAPLVRAGSKLRLARPEERNPKRLENPQTEWDILQGLIVAYRAGDMPVARVYLDEHAEGKEHLIIDLLSVWTSRASDEAQRKEGPEILFGLK
jgi:adenine-specific DNA methylase